MSWINVGVAAAGMLAKYKADKDAQNRRESLRGGMEQYQRMKAQDNESSINQLVQKQTPAARGTELAAVTDDRARSLQGTVNAAQATEAAPIAGKLSGDYSAAQERAANTVSARTKRAIEQLSTMGAPGEVGLKSSMRFGRAAGVVDANNRAISNVGNAYMTDINNVRPDPFLNMAGDAAIAYGTSGALGGGAEAAEGSNYVGSVGGRDVAGYGGAGDVASNPNLVSNADGTWSTAAAARQAKMKRGFSLWGR